MSDARSHFRSPVSQAYADLSNDGNQTIDVAGLLSMVDKAGPDHRPVLDPGARDEHPAILLQSRNECLIQFDYRPDLLD